MTGEVTVDEAVPVYTVLLQRLLAERGARSIAFKGPAFVALGVRLKRRSNDVDLLIHPRERDAAWSALRAAGWESVTPTYPASADPFYHSVTFAHRLSPVTLDLHHRILGLMREPEEVFAAMWEQRVEITLAHQDVVTLSVDHALVVEAVNMIKGHANSDPRLVVRSVVNAASTLGVQADRVLRATQELGASRSAQALLLETGALAASAAPDTGDRNWACPHDGRKVVLHLARHAPRDVLPYLWHHAVLSSRAAHSWAELNGVEYRGRAQVYGLRMLKLLIPRRLWSRLTSKGDSNGHGQGETLPVDPGGRSTCAARSNPARKRTRRPVTLSPGRSRGRSRSRS